MTFFDSLNLKFGVKKPEANSSAGFSSEPQCPHEAEILTYSEGSLSNRRRSKLEHHFSSCDNCRSLLALLAKFNDATIESPVPLSEDAIIKQTTRIFAFIENDESKRSALTSAAPVREQARKKRAGFYVSYPQLATAALLMCAIGAGGIYWLTLGSPEKAAMQQLASSMKDERRSATRISGGIEHSPYISTRDASASDDLPLKQALIKLKFAESETAPAEARQALARVHLAFEKPDHAQQALTILEQLAAGNAVSAEIMNDLGVAQFQLANYDDSIANFDKALEQKPDYFEALFNRALAEEGAGRDADARRDWRQFINSSNDPEWKAEAESHLNLLPASPNQ